VPTHARAGRGATQCIINIWSALRRRVGKELPQLCRCGHSAMCHLDYAHRCRLVDYLTDQLCECTGFQPTAESG